MSLKTTLFLLCDAALTPLWPQRMEPFTEGLECEGG